MCETGQAAQLVFQALNPKQYLEKFLLSKKLNMIYFSCKAHQHTNVNVLEYVIFNLRECFMLMGFTAEIH